MRTQGINLFIITIIFFREVGEREWEREFKQTTCPAWRPTWGSISGP